MADQQKYSGKLRDAHVLIIGGSSGLGLGIAEACLEHGARVTISSSQSARVQDAVAKLQNAYPSAASKVAGETCDLGDESTIEKEVKRLFENAGKVDHVVYTAGDKLAVMPLGEITIEKAKQAGMVRFFGPLIVARHASEHLTPGPRSSFTLTNSSLSEKPMLNWTVVAAFGGGISSMTRNLALDMAPIRVNTVSPAAVDTELWSDIPEDQKNGWFEQLASATTTGRVGQVGDVVEAYLYAMKDTNLSGSILSTNGGFLLR
ncbi:hypothetical protein W97_00411 [Coniosporium apollinis CBS 100218]|uniref:NAD(P)-binding protein n=1 Tax=Coniosporium apollinis (strain CBS 100218) TaxID=1168221 RepID=R7YHC7_CONA1|nr:uncharacterized protein W97_00411 [Coniosporium apollinis CBS 100218]EON61199.1 hypothetical protein W97_00411 [Coniosporium apollinis CBS 100218]